MSTVIVSWFHLLFFQQKCHVIFILTITNVNKYRVIMLSQFEQLVLSGNAPILDSRCWILDAGFSMLDSRCWILSGLRSPILYLQSFSVLPFSDLIFPVLHSSVSDHPTMVTCDNFTQSRKERKVKMQLFDPSCNSSFQFSTIPSPVFCLLSPVFLCTSFLCTSFLKSHFLSAHFLSAPFFRPTFYSLSCLAK
jgi:hypothetical protein